MNTAIAIAVILVAIGVLVTYGTYCIREKTKIEKTIETVIQFEIEFDTLKHTENRIRSEMSVYETSVPKSNYTVYTKMLSDVNAEMGTNVRERSKLLIDLSNFAKSGKSSRVQYRINRCTARQQADELRCSTVNNFVRKMAIKPRSSFQGLKALGAELKLLDRETT